MSNSLTYTLIETLPFGDYCDDLAMPVPTSRTICRHLAAADACRLRDLLESLRPVGSDVEYHITAETGYERSLIQ